MSRYHTIRLPFRQEDGSIVDRTLQGEWVFGMGDRSERPIMSQRAAISEREQWGSRQWFVIRSASGKLVVYGDDYEEEPATVAIYDSFPAMQPHVPPSIYQGVLERIAGLPKPVQFPEIPLDGV
jgi:hypothetical protein